MVPFLEEIDFVLLRTMALVEIYLWGICRFCVCGCVYIFVLLYMYLLGAMCAPVCGYVYMRLCVCVCMCMSVCAPQTDK